jgi:glyoxylase-like metal-dependent hydrolase (beta-lactamase superfamily II)
MKHSCESVRIKKNLYCLGPPFLPVYLLDGDFPVLFDAGMSSFSSHYISEIKAVLNGRSPKFLLLSHMHFDHCGSAGYLKEAYPELVICASAEGAEIIQKPSAVKLISELSNFDPSGKFQEFKPFAVDKILEDGERLPLSAKTEIEVISSPGHTRDMLSFYLPQQLTLIPSEAAGVPAHNNYVYTEFLVDCNAYFQSLKRLSGYPFDTLLFAHNYFYTDTDAHTFFNHAIKLGYSFQKRLLELLDRYGSDLDSACQIVKQEEYDQIKDPKQPEPAYLLNLKAKLNAVDKWRLTQSTNDI